MRTRSPPERRSQRPDPAVIRYDRAVATRTVQINLRVPDITVQTPSGPKRISNGDVRFWRTVEVGKLPSVGDTLELSALTGRFDAAVKRVDWQDDKDCFVVTCHYAKRSMPSEEYDSLKADLDWTMKPLLPLA